ncbi:MAG: thiamine-phosphate kinase [Betaproteobacteria bacterium]|nr:thiamine-phosphate kinase [Betaproteobacteria bacterium]
MTPEFALIAKHFSRAPKHASLGVGDDCALLSAPPGFELAISTDTLVCGTHFFPDANPRDLGHKALAVNLSDLAAMGAMPRAVLLALTLPRVDDAWLAEFARGFWALADEHGMDLIGGDTTRGPLSMTLTVIGEVETGRALRREGAKAGDDLWVSGELGGAALALMHLQGKLSLQEWEQTAMLPRLLRPAPRVALGRAMLGCADAAIDISDGLIADVGHICARSRLGAIVEWDRIPLPAALRAQPEPVRRACALAGGEDYELAFTAPENARDAIESLAVATRVGCMHVGLEGVQVRDSRGQTIPLAHAGFDHFGGAG